MNIDVKKIANIVWKQGIGLYVASYVAVSAHVGYDFVRYNSLRIEQGKTVQYLEVRRYHIDIDGEEKELTLVGENHDYNKTEYEMAQKLVDEHQHFAEESGSGHLQNMSFGNLLYALACFKPLEITLFYQHLGNGRWYDSIRDIAEERGYNVHALEKADDPFTNMSTGERIKYFAQCFFSPLTAPLAYYGGKNETPYDPSQFANFSYRTSLVDKRDRVMADSIVDLMREDDIDELLAEFGRLHLDGVISHLSQQVSLREICEDHDIFLLQSASVNP
ncbi:hypothetical protein HYW21_04495 [Candidatus Woesearchaeota archaeon]|nr:hypothetical protein [Candidatus Woesearchaeota archaeon]